MTALVIYLTLALGVSFICSIAEAVLLSVSQPYVAMLEQRKTRGGKLLAELKADIESPLSAILSLNTIAHTVGAVGVGAQAAKLFGDQYVALISAVLTLLVLILSEIIPKTVGTYYWKHLAVYVAFFVKYLVITLSPLVWFSKKLTQAIANKPEADNFSREELSAMANIGEQEGHLSEKESKILTNLFKLKDTQVIDAMTPHSVVFSVPESMTVDEYFSLYRDKRFSRIPVYADNADNISGFVLRSDVLMAKAGGNGDQALANYKRKIYALLDKTSLLSAFELFLEKHANITYVVNEYGTIRGVITIEDILETLTGLEIVDEGDFAEDMQKVARQLWRDRAAAMGIDITDF
ncbi:MAG: DUF21 domain-containing protein [Gammaproteobacteria bacterium]|nr:DUF21 domain-containing protein [Gammaproteobacteria bacterium]MBT8151193.1 DUF21 domain-containing protein [Gammaproteobacteria bacterium]NNM11408.1 DUF21 domain-containing protein [Pseudomonadales bacterium]